MKRVLSLMLVTAIALVNGSATLSEDDKVFKVSIEQNGERVKIRKGKVELEKAPFKLLFEFSQPMAVMINASFDKTTYVGAKKKKSINELPGFEGTGMAEVRFNTKRNMIVSYDSFGYWYYKEDGDSRFNEVEKRDNGILCTRTIEQLFVLDGRKDRKLEDMDQDLYLTFFTTRKGGTILNKIEQQREYLAISWK